MEGSINRVVEESWKTVVGMLAVSCKNSPELEFLYEKLKSDPNSFKVDDLTVKQFNELKGYIEFLLTMNPLPHVKSNLEEALKIMESNLNQKTKPWTLS